MAVPAIHYVMSSYEEKNHKASKDKKKKKFEELEQMSQFDMAGMSELSDQVFKTTMIIMLRDLMNKVDRMQEQMDNAGRELEILRKKQT